MHPVTECLIWHKIPFVICQDTVVIKNSERVMRNKIVLENDVNLKRVYYRISNAKLWQKGLIEAVNCYQKVTPYSNFDIGFSASKSIKYGDFIPFLNKWSGISFIQYSKEIKDLLNKRNSQINQKRISLIEIECKLIDVNLFRRMVL